MTLKAGPSLKAVRAALALQWKTAPGASLLAAGGTVLYGASAAAGGWLLKLLLDELGRGPAASEARAVMLAVSAAAVAAVAGIVLQGVGHLTQAVRWAVTVKVERALFERVSGWVGLSALETPAVHAQLKLAEQAAQEAPQQLSELVWSLLRAAAALGSSVAVVWWVSPPMVLALAVAGGVGLAAQLLHSRIEARVAEALAATYRWRDHYRVLLLDPRAAKEVRLYGLQPLLTGRLLGTLGRARDEELKLSRRSALTQSGLGLLTALVTALGAVLVARGALQGRFTAGDVSLFLAAVAGVQAACSALVLEVRGAARSVLLFESYLQVLARPDPQPRAGRAAEPLERGLELRDVWFRYHAEGPWVLQGVNLSIGAGETVGLVGVNGAGKSTLVKLLGRFYDPDRGVILWDGVDLRELDPASLRQRLSATFQDFMSYDATAADNIGFGDLRLNGDLQRIRAAACLAGIDPALLKLPDGYHTLLSRTLGPEDDCEPQPGATLSGGQWQRVAIARSLLKPDADLLILDEPTASLDPLAEAELHEVLSRHGAGRARLLISHRLSALRDADRIVVLSDGRIIEDGPHRALIRAKGVYAQLFGAQARGYRAEAGA